MYINYKQVDHTVKVGFVSWQPNWKAELYSSGRQFAQLSYFPEQNKRKEKYLQLTKLTFKSLN